MYGCRVQIKRGRLLRSSRNSLLVLYNPPDETLSFGLGAVLLQLDRQTWKPSCICLESTFWHGDDMPKLKRKDIGMQEIQYPSTWTIFCSGIWPQAIGTSPQYGKPFTTDTTILFETGQVRSHCSKCSWKQARSNSLWRTVSRLVLHQKDSKFRCATVRTAMHAWIQLSVMNCKN